LKQDNSLTHTISIQIGAGKLVRAFVTLFGNAVILDSTEHQRFIERPEKRRLNSPCRCRRTSELHRGWSSARDAGRRAAATSPAAAAEKKRQANA
jgi:hypothetical protein